MSNRDKLQAGVHRDGEIEVTEAMISAGVYALCELSFGTDHRELARQVYEAMEWERRSPSPSS